MKTTKAFERLVKALWAVCIAGCASSPGTSGETHFQCSATPDCAKHGPGLVCVAGTCVPGDGGSQSTSVPPRAAAYITVVPALGGGRCTATHGLLAIPLDMRVYDNLQCDVSSGCDPNQIVAVDGDPATEIACNIGAAGDLFNISASLRYQGDTVTISGAIANDGGDVQMTHYFQALGTGLSGTCTTTITENGGSVAPGRVWANFTCPDFTDPSSPGGMDCAAEGAFLFERCDGG